MSLSRTLLTLHNIDAQSPRKVAAFHLHLMGPALQWYNGLEPAVQSSWANLVATFKGQIRFSGLAKPYYYI